MSESVGSNSPPLSSSSSSTLTVEDPSIPITDRIIRALSHNLSLLHRSGSNFFILGSTFNVYSVSLSPSAHASCTCPDRVSPCKHILFVYLRVLNLSLDDFSLGSGRMSFCTSDDQLVHVLARQTGQGVWASPRAIARFHQLHNSSSNNNNNNVDGSVRELGSVVTREDTVCPVCLEEMRPDSGDDGAVVRCRTCRNGVHAECFKRWKMIRGRQGGSCVVCRERWPMERKRKVVDKYLNLGGYLGPENDNEQSYVL